MKKFSAHFHKKAKKWYIKHYFGSSYIGKKINKKGVLVRRYKQNYKFEYLDFEWNEIPRSIDEKDANQKTKNLINRRIDFLYSQEIQTSKSNSEKLFFPWAYNFTETKTKTVNFKPVINHLLAFSTEKLVFKDINERFCHEFKTYLLEAPLSPRGILKTTTIKQYFDHFKHIIKVCFLEKLINDNYSKNINIKNNYTDLQQFMGIDEIKTLIKSKTIYPSITNAFIFGCLTGLGENDLKELEWLDFELIEGDYFIKLNRNNEIYKLKISRMAMDFIGNPLKVRGKVFFKLKSTYYTNLKLREWLISSSIFKELTFKSCKYTFAANYLLKSEGFAELANNSSPSLGELTKILNHKQEYYTKKFVNRINLNRPINYNQYL
ncbi:site-specific integrase [Bacteroidota bacterium]|nr:site-specific integrase [Bacteroidota bacterium]